MLGLYRYKYFSAAEFKVTRSKLGSNNNLLYPWTRVLSALRGVAVLAVRKIKHVSAYVIKRVHVLGLMDQSIDQDRVQKLSRRLKQSQDDIRSNSILTLCQLQCKIT